MYDAHPIMNRESGFSIVEALVALLVLSIGMLGIAALYVESLGAGRSAIYRTQAVNLASDMADRIRANRLAGVAYDTATYGGNPTPQGCVGGAACTAQQLAQDDLARWLDSIRNPASPTSLPGNGNGTPDGTVTVAPLVTPTQYTIQVTWSEPGEVQPLTYALTTQI